MLKYEQRKAIIGLKDKGGAKLSTSLIAMATVLRATAGDKFRVHVIDADGFNSTLTQRLGERDEAGRLLSEQDAGRGVLKADLFRPEGVAPLFEAVESDARFVMIDTPAGGLTKIDELSENLGASQFIQHIVDCGRQPIVMVPFSPDVASIRGVAKAVERFGASAPIVAMRSMVGVKESDYRLWSAEDFQDQYGRQVGGRTRAAFEAVGGRMIDIPALTPGSNAMAEALSLTYAQAAAYAGGSWQTYDRLNVQQWLRGWVSELQKVADLLGLEDADWRAF
ncbi:hypothetical protein DAH66_02530 [Sphingomonas koreensis]|uniref:ParA family protein n=1 Tax=Sphingomonas koreensis TaxID=93064 RepID=A0A430G7Q9_9SPHN|nr:MULTISPECIES: hypothetical protein [Sphingomonas]MDK2769326.1 ParA family protein [Sphingomonas sp.]PKP92681.1 MAG: hypothetical protein CVT77_07885 [Alphaproteobacteria bacterium HGW-Alphaproteobacteria-16]RSY89550.1 hypothetical protein DAH66_02530 [Sphingomonas koreensis]